MTVMHSNNEIGVLLPIAAIATAAHAAGALVHTDAAQSVGKIRIDVRALDVDLLSVAGYKLYAPKAVGALYVRRETPMAPFTLGAGHERDLRPGTENVAGIAGIAGLGAACDAARRSLDAAGARMSALRDRVWTLLLAAIPEVGASTGSACHDGYVAPSSVLLAMGMPAAEATGPVRLSLGCPTTDEEIECAADALCRAWRELHGRG